MGPTARAPSTGEEIAQRQQEVEAPCLVQCTGPAQEELHRPAGGRLAVGPARAWW